MKLNKFSSIANGLVLSCLISVGANVYAGHYYEAVTTDRMEGQEDGNRMLVKSWVEGDKARVEFHSGERDGWMADGNYLITTDGGENVYLVDPKEQTYAPFSFEKMMATVGQAMDMMGQLGAVLKFEFTDVSTEKVLEESGEKILSQATTHYRFKTHYVMSMSIMGMKRSNTSDMTQDIWTTDKLNSRGFTIWLRPDRGLQTGNEGLDSLFNQEMGKIKGFPLRIITDGTMTDNSGEQQKNHSSTEVTLLREETIPDTTFELPSGYARTSLVPELEEAQEDDQGDDNPIGGLLDLLKR